MNEVMSVIFGTIVIVGALATIFSREPFDKLISLGVVIGGIMPFFADRGLLDILAATALIAPLATLFILMAMRRERRDT